MTDIYSKKKRSAIMSAVRSRGNKSTELKVVALFREYGIHGWRRHVKMLGSPDFVFPKEKVILFVDGCFWHACPTHFKMPESNREFWEKRIGNNQKRDRRVRRKLRADGWSVVRVWEHDLRKPTAPFLSRLKRILASKLEPETPV